MNKVNSECKLMNKKFIITLLTILIIIILVLLWIILSDKDSTKINNDNTTLNMEYKPVYEKGMYVVWTPLESIFTWDVWTNMLWGWEDYNSYDVVFSKWARTVWHSHTQIQLLFVLSWEWWYQEEWKPAQLLKVWDRVEIPANVIHWHWASAGSDFEHLGLTLNPSEDNTQTYDAVSEEEYKNLIINN